MCDGYRQGSKWRQDVVRLAASAIVSKVHRENNGENGPADIDLESARYLDRRDPQP
jgi:hypothetical protein